MFPSNPMNSIQCGAPIADKLNVSHSQKTNELLQSPKIPSTTYLHKSPQLCEN